MNSSTGLGITTSRKIAGGRVVDEEVVQLPTIKELRETLSYRGSEDQSFRWRGQVLAYGKYDSKEKQYVLDHPLNVIKDLKTWDVNFPTWLEAYNYLDKEKEEILAGILTLIEIEEDE
jgi:hypothetical protein|tara:strand:- start:959 stop:1312 length:354 start_codon:yes stop_codon:yes gene_type:complete